VLVATHDLESASRDFDLVLCLNRRLVALGPPESTCTEEVISETFSGHVLRVGSLLVDTAHHHHGAG
jgi:ABC-type Mn2+/Zn2+ transport system ATPase subunit